MNGIIGLSTKSKKRPCYLALSPLLLAPIGTSSNGFNGLSPVSVSPVSRQVREGCAHAVAVARWENANQSIS